MGVIRNRYGLFRRLNYGSRTGGAKRFKELFV